MLQTTHVGQFLLHARKRAGMKQEAVALSVGCTGSYINRCEKGKGLPSFQMAAKMESALRLIRGELIQMVADVQIGKIMQEANSFGATLFYDRIADVPIRHRNGHTVKKSL